MPKKHFHNGHRERLRKRFWEFGSEPFHDHELIELLLFYGIPRKNTNEIAHELIERFHSINGILTASVDELCKVDGIGRKTAEFIKMFGDVCREQNQNDQTVFSPKNSEEYQNYFRKSFQDSPDGSCLIMCPGTNCRIKFEKEGIFNGSVDIIQITNKLIKRECNSVIIGISKLNGFPAPDMKDFELARLFCSKLSGLGITLEDFVIVGTKEAFSVIYDGTFTY